MSWTRRSNEKRIAALEKRMGIVKDYTEIDYWQELNEHASRVFYENRNFTLIRIFYELPEHLQFARKIFDRLLELYRKLYEKILKAKQKKEELFKQQGCLTQKKYLSDYKIYVEKSEYHRIMLACVIRKLPMVYYLKNHLFDFMPSFVLMTSKKLVELGAV